MKALSVALVWFHLIAAYGMVGMILFIRFISTPVMRKLEGKDANAIPLLVEASDVLVKWVWRFIAVIIATGIPITLLNDHYNGLFQVRLNDAWTTSMLIKHAVFVGFGISMALYTWVVKSNSQRLRQAYKDGYPFNGSYSCPLLMDRLALYNAVFAVSALALTALKQFNGDNYMFVFLNFVHMAITTAWLGGMAFLSLVGGPLVTGKIEGGLIPLQEGVSHMHIIATYFIKVLWFAIFTTLFSGFFMLFLDPRYLQFLKSLEGVNLVMLVKLVAFVLMITGAFRVTPAIIRLGQNIKQLQAMKQIPLDVIQRVKNERTTMLQTGRFGVIFSTVILLITSVLILVKG